MSAWAPENAKWPPRIIVSPPPVQQRDTAAPLASAQAKERHRRETEILGEAKWSSVWQQETVSGLEP